MKLVQPIRDKETVVEVKRYLQERNQRNYLLFIVGIYTGLRVSDILSIRVSDIKQNKYLIIKESKTNKTNRIELHGELKRELLKCIKDKKEHEYIFQSRKGHNKPISRITAYRILKDAAQWVGLTEIGTHTMRKTFGYHLYNSTKDIATLQKIFNHSSPQHTLRYIGITQETLDDFRRKVHY